MPSEIDPTLPGWSRGVIAVLTQTPLANILVVVAAVISLWAQSHWQHEDDIAVKREAVAASFQQTEAIKEQTKVIQSQRPLVYGSK